MKRGSTYNPDNRFHQQRHEVVPEWMDEERMEAEENRRTNFTEVHPRSIINKVDSPDIPLNWSMNPYQGCEHGCSYCYARNSHEYWGFSAGLDFEREILLKRDAPRLLRQKLQNPNWSGEPIMLSGNTDCYQPIERKLGITRSLLEVFREFRHPVGIITKNALVLRDIDILKDLAKDDLVHVSLSITSLDNELQNRLEPRASAVKQRLKALEELSTAGIPVNVMIAPVIPGLTSHEVLPIMEEVANRGARSARYIMVRLNGHIGRLFEEWLEANYPDRKERVLKLIRETHGGTLNENRWGVRMKGEGEVAAQVKAMYKVGLKRFFKGRMAPAYNRDHYPLMRDRQLRLF
ncbi:MAG: PA0069 family radical SAM protein [Bacteroidota bacterium]|nr:PA0069 family radical SAM protein [Bacteroidota bacterium]MDX5428232.1 PA0069 family radical SAM protein [Bacteroidota bacterium]MDX5447299.1 PA0069 family radical SAM protein [Bacteroidota bacterium]MDX5506013.1 PA0069 family radical SAM protein [Bacteroidota bacterium]